MCNVPQAPPPAKAPSTRNSPREAKRRRVLVRVKLLEVLAQDAVVEPTMTVTPTMADGRDSPMGKNNKDAKSALCRDNEKRHGAGNANWGNEEGEYVFIHVQTRRQERLMMNSMHKLEHLDANNASEALKEYAEGETAGLDANGDVATPAEKEEEEEEPQLTLEEYKAQLAAKRANAALPAARAANKGEAIKGVTSSARREEEDFYVGKKADAVCLFSHHGKKIKADHSSRCSPRRKRRRPRRSNLSRLR